MGTVPRNLGGGPVRREPRLRDRLVGYAPDEVSPRQSGEGIAALSNIESFVASNHLDGVDLDFEPNTWTSTMWSAYTGFVRDLVNALTPAGRAVEVDLEPFTTTPFDAERYANVASAGAHLVVMAYDHEFDLPCAPISPYAWLEQVVTYAQSQVAASDLTIGLPAYGYTTPRLQEGQARHLERRLRHHAEPPGLPDHSLGRREPP